MSYFFHKIHEQSYVAHVIAYSLCSGPYRQTCTRQLDTNKITSASSSHDNPPGFIFALIIGCQCVMFQIKRFQI